MDKQTLRTPGMGITAREKPKGSGRWRLFYNKGGRTREIPGFTFKTKHAAEDTAEKLRARLSLGLSIHDLSKDAPPLNIYALSWLDRVKRQVKATTWKGDYGIAINRHIVPYFGSRPINEIRPADIRAFLDYLAEKGLAEKTVKNIRVVLSSIFRSALEEERVDRNPVQMVRHRMSRRQRKKQFNTLTLEEVHRLLDTIQAHYPGWSAFFTVLGFTGLRLSEIRGLRWSSVHLGHSAEDPRRFLNVRETITGHDLVDDVTKTGRQRRVDLNTEARQALLDHHVEEISKGRGRPDDLVFCKPSGAPISKRHPNVALEKACELAGLQRITAGDLRHTYITLMLYELEEDLLYVIEQVGHSSVKMVLDHYGHPERYHRPEKVDRLVRKPATDRPSPAISSLSSWKIRENEMVELGLRPGALPSMLPGG